MSDYILALTTVPDEEKGKEIAGLLVEENLAACVTISSACLSLYRWEEKIAEDREFMLFIKTREKLFPALERRIHEIHPYEVPEVIALPITRGSEKYLSWLSRETRS